MKTLFKILIVLIVIYSAVLFVFSLTNSIRAEMITTVGEILLDGENSVRYQDMLIYYDTEFERNEHGYEILAEVDGGFVIEKGDLLSLTDSTYILSGHGKAADFLREIDIGDVIRIENNKVTVSKDLLTSNLKIIEIEDQKINKIIDEKTEDLCDIDYCRIDEINKQLEKEILYLKLSVWLTEGRENIDSKLKIIHELLDSKYYCTVEAKAVEIRGLWHRPNASGIKEKDLDGLREFVGRIRELGINTLYVETFWHGMTTYYSDYLGLAHPQMKDYSYGEYGGDYMLALISECHKAGIEVHAWFEALSLGLPQGKCMDYVDPDWIVYNLEGDRSECFADPTNPEVKDFLLNIISEMLAKYDFDGISYDYVRYYESGEFDGVYQDGGFSENAIDLFSSEYGYQGNDLLSDVVNDENVRAMWQEFKTNAISSLIGEMSSCVRSIDPDIVISTSPYGHLEYAKSIYMQDVAHWCAMGYVDVILPMIYTENLELYVETVESFNTVSDNVLQVPGVYSMYYSSSLRVTETLLEAISHYASGNSIFASQNLVHRNNGYSREILSVLSSSSHRGTAISSSADVNDVFSAFRESLLDRTNRIYARVMLQNELDLINEFCSREVSLTNDPRAVADLIKELYEFKEQINGFSNASLRNKLTEQVDYICEILDKSITRYLIGHGYWDPAILPERPDVYTIHFSNN